MTPLFDRRKGSGEEGHDGWERQRSRLLDLLRAEGIRDEAVLAAMERVPRHLFVPEAHRALAYANGPLEIGYGQTISQPYMVAAMTAALETAPGDRVLEVGTGSGYQTAILADLVREVVTIERVPELTKHAARCFEELGYGNITQRTGDGTMGTPDLAPFDGILVTAGAPDAPAPLLEQLADGGKLVIPIGDRAVQQLCRYCKTGRNIHREILMACMFVPLIGEHGWDDSGWKGA